MRKLGARRGPSPWILLRLALLATFAVVVTAAAFLVLVETESGTPPRLGSLALALAISFASSLGLAYVGATMFEGAASNARSQFLANVSHEIRTPLTGLVGMMHILHRTELSPTQDRYVSSALSAADALLTVTGAALDFSKIEAGRLDLEKATFSPTDLVDGVVRVFALKAESKGVELVYRIDPEIPQELIGDPKRIRQVLTSLVGNALKFTDCGHVFLDCGRVDVAGPGVGLCFVVEDTGCGIQREHLTPIFDPFSQADGSMTRVFGGTGLGLAVCRQLCELMDGRIGVESTPGLGTKFSVTIRVDHSTSGVERRRFSELDGLRILIVDDCKITRQVILGYIETWGGAAEGAADASEAMRKLHAGVVQGKPYSLAVIDRELPGVDTRTLSRLIREEASLTGTGLILLGRFASMITAETEGAGFLTSIPKPFRMAEVHTAVVEAEQLRRSAQSPQAPSPEVWPPEREKDPWSGSPQSANPSRDLPIFSGTVLLADDTEMNRNVVGEMLASLGCECIFAHNGQEAVARATKGDLDLVLMDCQMPVMDGYAATREIRAWEASRNDPERLRLPVVALTAYTTVGNQETCVAAGMDDFMTKPLDPDALMLTLKRWLPIPERRPESQEANRPLGESASVTETQPAPIDHATLLQRFNGRKSTVDRLAKKFTELAPTYVQDLAVAVENKDAAAVSFLAHRLKGSAASICAESIRSLAEEIESCVRENELARVAGRIDELQSELSRLLEVEAERTRAA